MEALDLINALTVKLRQSLPSCVVGVVPDLVPKGHAKGTSNTVYCERSYLVLSVMA